MSISRVLNAAVGVSLAFATAGCGGDGPELASVEGTVTLDGQPLEGAKVVFTPVGPGRPAYAWTDAGGRYELAYTNDEGGALLGEHVVAITTHRRGDPESDVVGAPELVPAKYNSKSELRKTVESGENVIDFDLDGKGKVVQPKE